MLTTPHSSGLPHDSDPSGLCPNPECDRYVQFLRETNSMMRTRVWPEYEHFHRQELTAGMYYQAWSCPVCKQSVVVFEERDGFGGLVDLKLMWPRRSPREIDPSIPQEIRALFSEGASSENIGAFRAAAAMYRAAVEAVCHERKADGKDLFHKIDDLKNKGVADDIVEDLHQGRMLGNWSLHDGLEFSADEVADVADLIYEALFQIYVQPAQRAALRASRKSKRDAHRARRKAEAAAAQQVGADAQEALSELEVEERLNENLR